MQDDLLRRRQLLPREPVALQIGLDGGLRLERGIDVGLACGGVAQAQPHDPAPLQRGGG